MKLDRSRIPCPEISLAPQAWEQIVLLLKYDFTLAEQVLRVQIYGKGCSGFTYAVGFTPAEEDDFILSFPYRDFHFHLHIDPFSAFYLQNAEIDYEQDLASGEEGFVVRNLNQKRFQGKFWKGQTHLVPPTLNPFTPLSQK